MFNRELGDVVDRALFVDLLELQWDRIAGQVFDGAADLSDHRFAGLDHRHVDHALVLAANQFGGLGGLWLQERGYERAVVHRRITENFLAFALDGVGSDCRCAQAGNQ
ncbi:hypothetical protein D3C81_1921430 [compost metagenome]